MTSPQTIRIDSIDTIDGIWQLWSEYDAMLIAVYKEALNEGAESCLRPPLGLKLALTFRQSRIDRDNDRRAIV